MFRKWRRMTLTCINVCVIALMLLQAVLPALSVQAAPLELTSERPVEKYEQKLVEQEDEPEDDPTPITNIMDDVLVVDPLDVEPAEPEPPLPPAPVELALTVDHLFIRAGERTTITLHANSINELSTEGLVVSLVLPSTLLLVDDTFIEDDPIVEPPDTSEEPTDGGVGEGEPDAEDVGDTGEEEPEDYDPTAEEPLDEEIDIDGGDLGDEGGIDEGGIDEGGIDEGGEIVEEAQSLTWTLPNLIESAAFSRTVTVQAIDTAIGIQVIRAVVADNELYLGHAEDVELGIGDEYSPGDAPEIQAASLTSAGLTVNNDRGDVTLLVSGNAADAGTHFQYTELFRAGNQVLRAASVDAVENNDVDNSDVDESTLSESLFLPMIVGSGAHKSEPSADLPSELGLTPTNIDGVDAYQMWQLDAVKDGAEVTHFRDDVRIYVDAAWLADQGVQTDSLDLWTRETPEDEWELLQFEYDAKHHLFAANLPHFSQFTLGDGMSSSGHNLPSIEGFVSDSHTGGASVSYPIAAPAGLGGMSPNISLSYSSLGADGNHVQDGVEYKTQASEIGYGWNLSGISYIIAQNPTKSKNYEQVYSLVLNGTSVTIRLEEGEWRTNPRLFAKIRREDAEYEGDGVDRLYHNHIWKITTTDGTRYEFGSVDEAGNRVNFDPVYREYTDDAHPIASLYATRDGRHVNRWYLRRVVDTLGNQMYYKYKSEQQKATLCVSSTVKNAGRNWYTRAIYPQEILWSAPNKKSDYKLRLNFNYHGSERSDYNVKDYGERDCNQAQFGKKNRLLSIDVQVDADKATPQTIRSYHLGHGQITHSGYRRLTLNSITQKGKNGSALNPFTFAYSVKDINRVYLKSADNGQGGKVNYVYARHKVECHSGCNGRRERYPVAWTVTENGLGESSFTKHFYGPPLLEGDDTKRWGRYADSGTFLGFKEKYTTHYDEMPTADVPLPADAVDGAFKVPTGSVVLRWEREEFHQMRALPDGYDREANAWKDKCEWLCNPDPRHGKQKYHEVRNLSSANPESKLYAQTKTEWQAIKRKLSNNVWSWEDTTKMYDIGNNKGNSDGVFPAFWVRQSKVTNWVAGAMTEQRMYYQSSRQSGRQYGMVTQVNEYAAEHFNVKDPDSPITQKLQRSIHTEYFPNTVNHVVNKPARVVVADNSNKCVAETRTIYDNANANWAYSNKPGAGLPAQVKTRLKGSCYLPQHAPTTITAVDHYDPDWSIAITYYNYTYGNPIQQRQLGKTANHDLVILTEYDKTYKLFPVKQSNPHKANFEEFAEYYGVNNSRTDGAYWGAMAEHCGVNEVCTRQKYDQFGRPIYRWINVVKNSGWSANSQAETRWTYLKRNEKNEGVTLKANAVEESNAPHNCGNFVRKLYNGLGQLVNEQGPDQFWGAADNSCITYTPNSKYLDREIETAYKYDGLGNQIFASVPFVSKANWANRPVGTSVGTKTSYDPLGRPTKSFAPNSDLTTYQYSGRASSIVARGKGSAVETPKLLQWTQTDGLGNMQYVRDYTYTPADKKWHQQGQVTLTHDKLGNLKKVVNAANATSTMDYDMAGRKLSMNDPDLGNWTYHYNRLGQLTSQMDAMKKKTCLYYEGATGRLAGKHFRGNSNCPGSLNHNQYHVAYKYDGGHNTTNRSRGQLTEVFYALSNGYKKTIGYDNRGRMSSDTVSIPETWGSGGWGTHKAYTTGYGYDPYGRQNQTTYPDGDVVTVSEFNSRGLPRELRSSKQGLLVTNTWYTTTGTPTYQRLPRHKIDLHRRWLYHGWTTENLRLNQIRVGTSSNSRKGVSYNRLLLQYPQYDLVGNITQYLERHQGEVRRTYNFTYDGQSRLLNDYGNQSFEWKNSGNFTKFRGADYSYGGATSHPHAVTNAGGRAYSYDANGNMTTRNTITAGKHTLKWDHENRLEGVYNGNSPIERYLYDDSGQRVKKYSGSNAIYYINSFYEVETGGKISAASMSVPDAEAEDTAEDEAFEIDANYDISLDMALDADELLDLEEQMIEAEQAQSAGDNTIFETEDEYLASIGSADGANSQEGAIQAAEVTELDQSAAGDRKTKYYYFNGQRIAMVDPTNGHFRYLHSDHLGSAVAATSWGGGVYNKQKYQAFGGWRGGHKTGFPSENRYTGQKLDTTGLMYYNARYYDPEIGQFISADTIVPNPSSVLDYNRYMYGLGNPVSNNDPSGHNTAYFDAGQCGPATCFQLILPDPRTSQAASAQQDAAINHLSLNVAASIPYLDTPEDLLVATTGCGYACQAGYEEPDGPVMRGVAAAAIILPFSSRWVKGTLRLGTNLWSTTKKLTRTQNALGHWRKHSDDFPHLNNALEYVDETHRFINEPPSTALVGSRTNGDIVVYDPVSDVFAVGLVDGTPKTMFIPDPTSHGYATNLDYYNANINN